MAKSFESDVRYTHSGTAVHTPHLILGQLFTESPTENNGQELLQKIPAEYKRSILKREQQEVSFPSFPHLPFRRLGKEGKLHLEQRVNVSVPVKYHDPAYQSTLPITTQDSRISNDLVFAAGHTYYTLSLPHLYSPQILPPKPRHHLLPIW